MTSFIYCFTTADKQDLLNNGYKFLTEENIGDKKAYVFLYDDKLNFTLNKNKFVVTNKMMF
ncbi:MAG: hypothetical protein PHS98_04420 [Bacilli bacterium]|nr:hypothetical protein [Bacilli bacterium]